MCEGLNIWFIELFTTLLSPRCLAHSKHYQCAPLDYNCVTGTRVYPTSPLFQHPHTHTPDIVAPLCVPLSVLIIPGLLYMSNGHSTWHARNQISCSFNEITQREIEKKFTWKSRCAACCSWQRDTMLIYMVAYTTIDVLGLLFFAFCCGREFREYFFTWNQKVYFKFDWVTAWKSRV